MDLLYSIGEFVIYVFQEGLENKFFINIIMNFQVKRFICFEEIDGDCFLQVVNELRYLVVV